MNTPGHRYLPVIRIYHNPDGTSAFETGKIPELQPMNTQSFWGSSSVEEWQKGRHTAPRRQFVATLKGTVRFKVSDGATFIIRPGILLLAEDTEGEGHSWEIIGTDAWERLYIPIMDKENSFFIADKPL